MNDIRISGRVLKIALVTLGVIGIGCGFIYLWSSGLFLPKYHLEMYAPGTEGILVGTPVRLDGINVGTVHAVQLAKISANPERRIELVLSVEKRYQEDIRTDSAASLTSDSVLGNKYVNIHRGFKGAPIEPGGEILLLPLPEAHLNLTDIIGAIAKAADHQNGQNQFSNPH